MHEKCHQTRFACQPALLAWDSPQDTRRRTDPYLPKYLVCRYPKACSRNSGRRGKRAPCPLPPPSLPQALLSKSRRGLFLPRRITRLSFCHFLSSGDECLSVSLSLCPWVNRSVDDRPPCRWPCGVFVQPGTTDPPSPHRRYLEGKSSINLWPARSGPQNGWLTARPGPMSPPLSPRAAGHTTPAGAVGVLLVLLLTPLVTRRCK